MSSRRSWRLAAWLTAIPLVGAVRAEELPAPAAEAPATATVTGAAEDPGEAAAPAQPTSEAAIAAAAPAVPAVQVALAGPQLLTEDLRPGSGVEAAPGMVLAVHYTGWLHDPSALGYRGRQFDSSRDRGSPLVLTLGAGRVIRGWDVGLLGLKVGGLRRLVIPPELAYGSRGAGNGLIPPNSTLVFEVELVGVESNTLVEGAK